MQLCLTSEGSCAQAFGLPGTRPPRCAGVPCPGASDGAALEGGCHSQQLVTDREECGACIKGAHVKCTHSSSNWDGSTLGGQVLWQDMPTQGLHGQSAKDSLCARGSLCAKGSLCA